MTEDHDDISLLLPWYVNGTLATDEVAAVKVHIEGCDICQRDLELLEKMSDAVQDAQPVPIVPPPPLKAFLEQVDADEAPPEVRMRRTGWLLVASLLVASVMLGRAVMTSPEPATPVFFETATTAGGGSSMQYVLELQFDPAASETQRQQVLAAIDASQVSASAAPDTIRAVVALPALSLADLDQYTQDVQSVAGVRTARVVALQLPVEVAE